MTDEPKTCGRCDHLVNRRCRVKLPWWAGEDRRSWGGGEITPDDERAKCCECFEPEPEEEDAGFGELVLMREERDNAKVALASACDLVNTICREFGLEEAQNPAFIRLAIHRIWERLAQMVLLT